MDLRLLSALRFVVLSTYHSNLHETSKKTYGNYQMEVSEDWHEKGEEVEDGEYNVTLITISKNSRHVGYAEFIHQDGDRLLPNNVEVDEKDQRQGLATAMYVQAEYETERTIKPHNIQSPEGRALWGQPDRPFG